MNEFRNATATNVGTTPVTVYTSPVGMRSMIIGINVANVYGATLGFDLYLSDGVSNTYLVRNGRAVPGQPLEFMRGNKLVVEAEQSLIAVANANNGVDVTVTVMENITIAGGV